MITVLKLCMKNCYFFIVISSLLSRSKNDQKCIVYPSHADILLQYHDIISPLRVLWGKNGLRDECGVEFASMLSQTWIQGKRKQRACSQARGNVSALFPMGERASKTRKVQSLVNPDIPASPAARHALEIETTDWNGQFFDRQKFWRRRLPLYFMTCIILTKDVVTFGSFNSIDGDGHENDKKSVGLG